ncbi:hypothetical protein H310_05587 [Aphanomyces invadans]|uniref:Uncharacterized protein n=1 Tax=Aphanomyces invadans TaxID=157072 RepID=A0A024UAC7_9STRA|nr:hypothetical protein H310_05587 [Aphanomyces invadans]ETW03170.1 hypothetical protein H310_05587 [Aphanomyces invadans]|eukprot:XP_008868554.1 hypothetical protein H310_05587 [Aphanomyces invadans]
MEAMQRDEDGGDDPAAVVSLTSARLRHEDANSPADDVVSPVVDKIDHRARTHCPAWDSNQFTSMMQTELLSYSLSVSVGPLANVMEIMGTTLQKHDDTLQHLLLHSAELDEVQAQTNQAIVEQADVLDNHLQDAIQSVRADLLALIHPLEVKADVADGAICDMVQQVEALRNRGNPGDNTSRPDDDAVAALAKRLDEMEVRLGRLQDSSRDEPYWKQEMEQSMQAQLSAMQQYMQSEFDSERQRIQDILNKHSSTGPDEEKQHLRPPTMPLPPLRRAQSHPSGLDADTPDLASMSKNPDAKNDSAVVIPVEELATIHQRLDQEEHLLEALRQQYEALQELVNQVQADATGLATQLSGINSSGSRGDALPPLTASSSSTALATTGELLDQGVDQGVVDDVFRPNDALAGELARQALILDALNKDVAELQAQRSARQRDVDKQMMDVIKQLKELATADAVHTSMMDTNKSSIQKVKADVVKVAADLQSLLENQSLLQGFQTSAGGGSSSTDLSMVFAKLAEMRKAQQDANSALQANVDSLVERQTSNQEALHALKGHVDSLEAKVGSHQTTLGLRDDEDAEWVKKMGRQLEAQLGHQKDMVQRGLHVQERVLTAFLDLTQRATDMRQDVEKASTSDVLGVKVPEIQKLFQVFHRMGPQISHVLALPPQSHEALQRIAHSIELSHFAPADAQPLTSTVSETHQMLSSLELHNENMAKQQGQIRTQLDELWHAWNAKMHMDMLAKYMMLSKELRDMIKQTPMRAGGPSSNNLHIGKHNNGSGLSEADTKVLETKLVSTNRRLNDIEENLRALSKNIMAYKQDMNDKVTAGNLSKLKFQVFSELAKIHAVLGSARFQGQGGQSSSTPMRVLDDTEIKPSLDDQAELIASLCNELKQSLAEKEKENEAAAGTSHHSLSKLSNENELFNAKLEAITEKVAELFMSLEMHRTNSQPRHAIPTYNPGQMLDSFAQNIDAKLAETQSLNRKEIHDIRDELDDLVRQRVAKAMETLQGPIEYGDGTTAGGSKPVVCIACSRPVKLETHIQDTIHDRLPAEPMVKVPHDPVLDVPIDEPGDEFHVYRAGFRMPSNDKRHNLGKGMLPLLNSMSPTASPTRRSRKKLTSPQSTE